MKNEKYNDSRRAFLGLLVKAPLIPAAVLLSRQASAALAPANLDYPHERANLSVVLYNCDCARLPYALVDRMNDLHEDEDDMRCQIFLRHRDGQKLRDLYETIIESSDADADSFVSSEASKDFMARLRIGAVAGGGEGRGRVREAHGQALWGLWHHGWVVPVGGRPGDSPAGEVCVLPRLGFTGACQEGRREMPGHGFRSRRRVCL